MTPRDQLVNWIEDNRAQYIAASENIWDRPELAFHEDFAADTLCALLEKEGFKVERGVAGMSTAFVATYGEGHPIIGIMGEYDALPGLSQEAECTERKALVEGGPGHGCGHNLLGTAGVAAVSALKAYMIEHGTKGTIRYYGCPAEEGGCGKAYMARAGLFSDLDAAFSWHPSRYLSPWMVRMNAVASTLFTFHGKAAHASSAPQMGRSALDACELMSVGVNYLREHVSPEAKMHYAYQDCGGTAPNIVQAKATVKHMFRAPTMEEVLSIRARVEDIARGAALMTGTTVEINHLEGYSNYVPNVALTKVMGAAIEEVGPIQYDEADYELAKKIRDTLPEDCTRNISGLYTGLSPDEAAHYYKTHLLYDRPGKFIDAISYAPASTDMGDVSYCVPAAQVEVPCYPIGVPNHTWQMTACTRSSIAMKGMLQAAKCMALCALKVFEDDGTILEEAKKEFDIMTGGKPYTCAFPDDLNPPR